MIVTSDMCIYLNVGSMICADLTTMMQVWRSYSPKRMQLKCYPNYQGYVSGSILTKSFIHFANTDVRNLQKAQTSENNI